MREAAWPAIRSDLGLGYVAIGVLLTVPAVVSGLLEPLFGLLADAGRRRGVVVLGGAAFALALIVVAGAPSYALILAGFVLLYPASGAFVSLSQATFMDLAPERREHNMARWVLAGSVGVVVGPLAFAGATWLGWTWRDLFFATALLTVPLVLRSRVLPQHAAVPTHAVRDSMRVAWLAMRSLRVLRWLFVLEVTDLLGDVFAAFLALYFVDVVGVPVATAALAVIVWTLAGLAGDALLVPLLRRVSGMRYLRLSAILATAVYPAFLVVPGLGAKLSLLAALGTVQAGWYAIPQSRLYGELHGNSGVVLGLSNLATLTAGLIPGALGLLAAHLGLGRALWVCAIAPPALLVALIGQNRPADGC